VFDISASKSWRSLGSWQLGLADTGMAGNGDYGLEMTSLYNPSTRQSTTISDVLVGAINDTYPFQGFIGIGVTQGRFGTNVTLPYISQLAQSYGTIDSHSYGYTAGAFYRDKDTKDGTPASLVLGGYDPLRFASHDIKFPLHPVSRHPTVRLRGIQAEITSLDKAPGANWTSTTQTLVSMNDSIQAVIDTSTPYLWMPTEVCDRFAAALNLTWREDLGVYIFSSGPQYTRFLSEQTLSFTFSLSSYENTDNFGQPLNVPGVVNITLPSAAFAQVLRYPFKTIEFLDSGVPYFPLKRSTKEVNNNRYIIGRAFMQEAYLITRYDDSTFSLHQARFPDNAYRNYSVKGIPRSPNSPYPAFAGSRDGNGGLSTSQTVGVVLSAFATGSVIGFVLWCCCRRRKRKAVATPEAPDENKEETQSIDGLPKSPVKRMFTMIIGRKRSKKPLPAEVSGDGAQPVEVGADEQHQVFELPVPPEPVELDSNDVVDDDSDLAEGSRGLSEYEVARRKLARQLQGPVPSYTPSASPPTSPAVTVAGGKSMQDVSPVAHYRPSEDPSPVSSPTYANSNSLPDSLPSPLSPHPDWQTRMFDLPSPMTVAPPAHIPFSLRSRRSNSSHSPISPHSPHSPQTFAPSSVSRSGSDSVSPTSPIGSLRMPPTPTVQRTPIDPTRVICLGPLPENVPLPNQQPPVPPIPPIPEIVTPDGREVGIRRSFPQIGVRTDNVGLRQSRASRGSNDSLGSNFTVEEERRLRGNDLSGPASPRPRTDDDFPRSPRSMERIEAGCELVHVPQVAEKRYSWEEK